MDFELTSVKELTERYGVSRQVIYKRMKHLGLEFIRGQDGKSLVDQSILQQLDSLDTHIKKYGEMKSYVPISQVEVDNSNPDGTRDLAVSGNNEIDTANGSVNNGDRVDLINEVANLRSLLEGLIGAIAMNAQEGLPGRTRPEDVLSIQDALYKAVERDYLLSGEQVKQILQRRSLPSGDYFAAYGFHLIKKGWSGKQRLWQVEKIKVNK